MKSLSLAEPGTLLIFKGPGEEVENQQPMHQESPAQTLFQKDTDRLRRDLEVAVAAICPPSLADHREDLIQEAMLKVTRIAQGSPPDREFTATYLWRTAYCALVDELRRLRRRAEVPLDEVDTTAAMASPNPGPHAMSIGREIRRTLAGCLERLVEARRLAVILHLQGERAQNAADLFGWPRKRVHNLTFRGLRDLRKCLESHGVTP